MEAKMQFDKSMRAMSPHNQGLPVYVVEDDPLMRDEVAGLLAEMTYTVRTFESADRFLEAEASPYGVLVVDLRLKGMSGLMLQRQLAGRPQLEIIFISGVADVTDSVMAMKAGAHEFLVKPFRPQALLDAVASAFQKLEDDRLSGVEIERVCRAYTTLTDTERQIAALLVHGLRNKQIAYLADKAENTVKVHRSRIMQKMGVTSVVELSQHLKLIESAQSFVPPTGFGDLP
jgi:FixJ family two-component response regulator